jgi:hypothetical protein
MLAAVPLPELDLAGIELTGIGEQVRAAVICWSHV